MLPLYLEPLPLGSVKPLGWLKDQLDLMADGLPGHEYDFYRIVRSNPWLGGSHEYSALNEAFPYWFNGLVPLAYATDSPRLKSQAISAAKHVLLHQQRDGWLGPETDPRKRNLWGRYPVLLGLAQLAEAEAGTPLEAQILHSMHWFFDLMHSMLADNYSGYVWKQGDDFDDQWGRSRAADLILVLQWLLERDAGAAAAKLFGCMQFINEKAHNWSYWYSDEVYIKQDLDTVPLNITRKMFPFEHGVNVGQALKAGAVIRRFSADDLYAESARRGFNWTFRYHGTPSGGVIADERLSGLSPVRGVELCSVVETMYSLSYLYQALGDGVFADHCERAAYNALPVMVMPDWWAHQYVAQTNQPISHELHASPFWNVGRFGQTFGLEPNYPCCVPNHIQGYPKFLSASFARLGSDGIAHALLGPGAASTRTNSGVQVNISCQTNYPFSFHLAYSIESSGPFTFALRVPHWADKNSSTVSVDSHPPVPVEPDSMTGLHLVSLSTAGKYHVDYRLSTEIRIEPRANDTVSIYHGALLYAIAVGENIHARRSSYYGAPANASEYTITPTTKWALAIDPSTLRFHTSHRRDSKPLPNPIWASGAPPVWMTASVCEIPWDLVDGYAPRPPPASDRTCLSEPIEVKLVPYGSAKLHMAELPTVDLSQRSQLVVQAPA